MNERIQELADQCRIEEYNEYGDLIEFGFNDEKFAELIIRECVEYYRSQIGETSEPHTKTLEYFGVEE